MLLVVSCAAGADTRKVPLPYPTEILIGRHTFVDFGPPLDFYELLLLRTESASTSIERIVVTPPADVCLRPATVQVATASVNESLTPLLDKSNPCDIPEKDLRRERKRCKKCLVFSGAEVVMQVQCGDQSRRIRMDILDRDIFDPNPTTPKHTSWTMALLGRIDKVMGAGVLDRPIFQLNEPPESPIANSEPDALAQDLSGGKFDTLFDKPPDKLSELLRQAQNPPPKPTVELVSSSPFRPISFPLGYPVLAKLTHTDGQVTFTAEVTPLGSVSNVKFLSGHPLLKPSLEHDIVSWKFPTEAAGQVIQATVEYKMNCSLPKR